MSSSTPSSLVTYELCPFANQIGKRSFERAAARRVERGEARLEDYGWPRGFLRGYRIIVELI